MKISVDTNVLVRIALQDEPNKWLLQMIYFAKRL